MPNTTNTKATNAVSKAAALRKAKRLEADARGKFLEHAHMHRLMLTGPMRDTEHVHSFGLDLAHWNREWAEATAFRMAVQDSKTGEVAWAALVEETTC